MAAVPTFTSTPRLAVVTVSSAVTARTGVTPTELIAGVAAGTKVNEIVAQVAVTGASTAALASIWITTDNGSNWYLLDEITLAAATASASVKATRNTATYSNLVLVGSTHKIGVTTTVAQAVHVTAMAGDLT